MMKKKLLLLVLSGLIILTNTGCIINKNNFDVGEKSDIPIIKNDLSLFLKEGTLSNKGATFILKNDSDVDIEYGNPYEIEIKRDGSWYKINVVIDFNMIAYVLKSNEEIELEIDWENSYGILATGEYRVIKSISVENEKYDTIYLAAEFIIN